jgi:hypothetical protein
MPDTYTTIHELPDLGAAQSTDRIAVDRLGAAVSAGAFVLDQAYQIVTVGSTNFTSIGAAANTVGAYFVATGAGSGSGTAAPINTGDVALSALPISAATQAALDGKAATAAPAAAVAAHEATADPHPGYLTPAEGNAAYAPVGQGVSNGNSHNHDGGDGAQIAYSSLSGLPTIPALSSSAPQPLGATAAAGSSGQAADAGHVHQRDTDVIVIPVGDESTALTAGTNKVRFRMPFPATLLAVRSGLNLAPTGSAFIVDVNEAGVSVLGTKLSIDATETSSTTAASAATITDSGLADDAEIGIDIDQIGSTVAGAGLKVYLFVRRT